MDDKIFVGYFKIWGIPKNSYDELLIKRNGIKMVRMLCFHLGIQKENKYVKRKLAY